ncbi:MAG: T9SS type A sorting domain-containing protein [Prevotella sp.]|nr:T9SS type A sorting domain-containing protein [Prevotella sp.]
MKQKLYSMLLLLAVTLTAHAADKQWCLVVESAGGETIAIGADLKPVIATTADGYELRYGEQVTAFTWSELKKVTVQETVADVSTPVKEVTIADPSKPTFRATSGEIVISGAEPGSVAQIFSLNGHQTQSARVGDSGSVSLDTTGLPAGIYIIKTNKSTFKLVKK